jgi:glycosyltransferase involved in cell wall biosynthesis
MIRRIYFYPFTLDTSPYSRLEIRILSELCDDIRPISPTELIANCFHRGRTVAILNLFEDRTGYHKNKPNRTLLVNIVLLLILKLTCAKIIWVRHNFWPHELPRKYFRQDVLLAFMKALSTKVVTHREVSAMQSVVAPHPLYFEDRLPETVRDIEFFYFGAIRRYKGLAALLAIWPRDRRLIIAGAAPDAALLTELRELAEARGLNVEFIARFVPDAELDALLLRTKFVVQPHTEDAMIVTGTFFHAASLGANIFAARNDFSEYLRTQFEFVNLFDDGEMSEATSQLSYVEPHRVVEQIRAKNGAARCLEVWKQILDD